MLAFNFISFSSSSIFGTNENIGAWYSLKKLQSYSFLCFFRFFSKFLLISLALESLLNYVLFNLVYESLLLPARMLPLYL